MTFLAAVVVAASFLWIIRRIWKRSVALALASLVLWPIVLLALVRYWDDEECDIRLPLATFLGSSSLTSYLLATTTRVL